MPEEADQEAALLQGNGGVPAAAGQGGQTTTGLINMAKGLLRLAYRKGGEENFAFNIIE